VEDLPKDLNDSAIVQAIVNLAKSLRMVVIAEGVETKAQLDFLRSLNCDAYQGYLGGRPWTPSDSPRFSTSSGGRQGMMFM